jgi:hypothetical protein
MSKFTLVPGNRPKATNERGVIVESRFDHMLTSYEVEGTRYLVPLEFGRKGQEYFDILYVDDAYKENEWKPGAPKLPRELLEQMRDDLPEAYAALGLKCIIR